MESSLTPAPEAPPGWAGDPIPSPPSSPAKQGANARAELGRRQSAVLRRWSRRKVADRRLMGSPSVYFPEAGALRSGVPPAAEQSAPVRLQQRLWKVRWAPDVGAASAEGVARSPEGPTHPSAGRGARRTLAAGGRSQETLRGAAGSSGESRVLESRALQPPGAASGCAPCSRRSRSFRGKTRAPAARGALQLLGSPPTPAAAVSRAVAARLAPRPQLPPH